MDLKQFLEQYGTDGPSIIILALLRELEDEYEGVDNLRMKQLLSTASDLARDLQSALRAG